MLNEITKNAILEKVLSTITDFTNIDNNASFDEELNLDSMKSVMLIVELEGSFNILFDEDEMLLENFSNITKIVNIVEKKVL